MFKKLKINGWRQFSNIDINFHDHLTVLTGANGAGKTTLLNLLSKSIGGESTFLGSYEKSDDGTSKYSNSLDISKQSALDSLPTLNSCAQAMNKFGYIEYSNEKVGDLVVPEVIKSRIYGVQINGMNLEKGVYIDSHRPIFPYKDLKNIPTSVFSRTNIFANFNRFIKTYMLDGYRNTEEMSATILIKQALASLIVFGYGNKFTIPNDSARMLFEGYVEILKKVLPPELGFKDIALDVPEIMLRTNTGNFPLDAASGGISSIIEMTWLLYMYADTSESFVALIDEPENHLHPELQKSLLSNLISAFPNVQFIVATHNPFMITAVKDSNVYVLKYNDNNKVVSNQLDYINKAGSSNTILREVLGIDSSIPIWAEKELKRIVEIFSSKDFTQDNMDELRTEMTNSGLSDLLPNTISKIIKDKPND
ncbi:MAG: AAA family ATPase [Firmicutes bacterium]|nr:AAA family ATPase [Candidatus Colivicinus equi]